MSQFCFCALGSYVSSSWWRSNITYSTRVDDGTQFIIDLILLKLKKKTQRQLWNKKKIGKILFMIKLITRKTHKKKIDKKCLISFIYLCFWFCCGWRLLIFTTQHKNESHYAISSYIFRNVGKAKLWNLWIFYIQLVE